MPIARLHLGLFPAREHEKRGRKDVGVEDDESGGFEGSKRLADLAMLSPEQDGNQVVKRQSRPLWPQFDRCAPLEALHRRTHELAPRARGRSADHDGRSRTVGRRITVVKCDGQFGAVADRRCKRQKTCPHTQLAPAVCDRTRRQRTVRRIVDGRTTSPTRSMPARRIASSPCERESRASERHRNCEIPVRSKGSSILRSRKSD